MNTRKKFYILNTNNKYRDEDQVEMLSEGIAAEFCERKNNIDKIQGGDTVFLYGNKQGILGYGQGSGIVLSKDRIRPENGELVEGGCHYQKLSNFCIVKPLTAQEIKEILQRNLQFNRTFLTLTDGQKLLDVLEQRN
ncbi:hypothetical protein [Microbulbifer marinus]|uniref:hypothetical protein n=1 Tax=Microbulbifer marinus TaxID=658218 RepID=UPI000B80A991|nr:hypothetical protein [Microbulbifer marinus]